MNKLTIAITAALIAVILMVSGVGILVNTALSDENHFLKEQLDDFKKNQPTLVFHVCEKGEEYAYAQLPNATYTYDQLLTLNNGTFDILLLPEYKGNLNWTEEESRIATNFGGQNGIPIMLDVFGGGSESTPTPMLTTEQITQVMNIANVKYFRIAEVISWHIENNVVFPTDYVQEVLEFCKSNNLQVFLTEWKDDFPKENVETFTVI